MFRLTDKKLRLCLPPLILCTFDSVVTLWNQPRAYWLGDYASAFEGNPIVYRLLAWSPLAYETGLILWLLIVTTTIALLPKRFAVTLSIAITFGHLWGVLGGIMFKMYYGFWICLAIIALTGFLITLSCENYLAKK
jgi:hypothetical protein